MGCSKSSSKKEVYSNTNLAQDTVQKAQIKNLTLLLKQLEREQTKPKVVNSRKEIIKIREVINETETTKTID